MDVDEAVPEMPVAWRGLSQDKKDGKYRVRINWQGKRFFLGKWEDPVEAARVYDRAAVLLMGHGAATNFGVAAAMADTDCPLKPELVEQMKASFADNHKQAAPRVSFAARPALHPPPGSPLLAVPEGAAPGASTPSSASEACSMFGVPGGAASQRVFRRPVRRARTVPNLRNDARPPSSNPGQWSPSNGEDSPEDSMQQASWDASAMAATAAAPPPAAHAQYLHPAHSVPHSHVTSPQEWHASQQGSLSGPLPTAVPWSGMAPPPTGPAAPMLLESVNAEGKRVRVWIEVDEMDVCGDSTEQLAANAVPPSNNLPHPVPMQNTAQHVLQALGLMSGGQATAMPGTAASAQPSPQVPAPPPLQHMLPQLQQQLPLLLQQQQQHSQQQQQQQAFGAMPPASPSHLPPPAGQMQPGALSPMHMVPQGQVPAPAGSVQAQAANMSSLDAWLASVNAGHAAAVAANNNAMPHLAAAAPAAGGAGSLAPQYAAAMVSASAMADASGIMAGLPPGMVWEHRQPSGLDEELLAALLQDAPHGLT